MLVPRPVRYGTESGGHLGGGHLGQRRAPRCLALFTAILSRCATASSYWGKLFYDLMCACSYHHMMVLSTIPRTPHSCCRAPGLCRTHCRGCITHGYLSGVVYFHAACLCSLHIHRMGLPVMVLSPCKNVRSPMFFCCRSTLNGTAPG